MNGRWQVYLFVLVTTLLFAIIAVLMDLATSGYCPEYFVQGKGLDAARLPEETIWLAIRASYWVGLLCAIALVAANEIGRWPSLPSRALYFGLLWVAAATAACVAISGVMHLIWGQRWLGLELHMLDRPRAFCLIWGINRGAYVGALIGVALAAAWLVWRRAAAARQA